MAEENPNTTGQEQEETKMVYGFGPKTESAVNEKLEMMAAVAFLGHRAFMGSEDEDSRAAWKEYLSEINCQFDIERLTERAFEIVLRLACQAWNEMFSPRDSVHGQYTDHTKKAPAPEGDE